MRIGLLGGSFNPAHNGHRHVAETARRALALDQVWLMVSPGNPLKQGQDMAPLQQRLTSAKRIADGCRIIATDIERHLGTHYTADTIRRLKQRFPRAQFVWIMGADNLVQLPRWDRWLRIAHDVPFAVLPRPRYNNRALASRAAHRLAATRHPSRQAHTLANILAPAWIFLPAAQHQASATALRAASVGAPLGEARPGGAAPWPCFA
jgi:nicotinate-nucleotide adenylyltransferase